MLHHIVAANLPLGIKLLLTPCMRTGILRRRLIQTLRMGRGDVGSQRLLLGKFTTASGHRALVLECTTVLGSNVHVNRTLVSLGVVTVRTLERAIGEADVFVGHFG